MYTLGINAAFHDSAACLIHDGKIIAASEEERFTHVKHGKRPIPFSTYELPYHAIDSCLKEADIHLHDVDHIAYSFDPYPLLGRYTGKEIIHLPLEPSAHSDSGDWHSPWDPLFLASIVNAPRHLSGGVPLHLQRRLGTSDSSAPYQWHFVSHHLAHAASAFHASPFQSAAILTLDGRGERATTTYGYGQGNQILPLGQVQFPNSLGLVYEEVTSYLGFLHSSDEYKVMALASYGKPRYIDFFRSKIRLISKGGYIVSPLELEKNLGPRRVRRSKLEAKHFDIASSLQTVLEERVLELSHWLHELTQEDHLCLAGGVALNCVLNSRIRDQGPFRKIWVQPAAGDAGTALGAALWIDAVERNTTQRTSYMEHAFLGPSYSDDEIKSFLEWSKLPYRKLKDIPNETADLLARNQVIGWFQGRMEFGPRALGGRSILASPIDPGMQARLNEIKDREDFRPVAPVVLEEEVSRWFHNGSVSPFMLFIFDVLPERANQIPAVRHVDGTARIQTINRSQNAVYYDLIQAFYRRTGVPILVNTSFNTRGEPIVCTPRDAVESFWTSPLDALVIGAYLLEKTPKEKQVQVHESLRSHTDISSS